MRDRGSNLSHVPEDRASERGTLMQFGRIIACNSAQNIGDIGDCV